MIESVDSNYSKICKIGISSKYAKYCKIGICLTVFMRKTGHVVQSGRKSITSTKSLNNSRLDISLI
jgi:hypothetical protein